MVCGPAREPFKAVPRSTAQEFCRYLRVADPDSLRFLFRHTDFATSTMTPAHHCQPQHGKTWEVLSQWAVLSLQEKWEVLSKWE
eukprot:scaffold48115_cov44-Phaeocystis_antarctica.AAC.1